MYTLIADYGQNMKLPLFGGNQPGDTYYYTPLHIYNVCLVDVSTPGSNQLFAHIYKDGNGKKGGNNVALLVMKTIDKLGLLDQEKGIGNELNQILTTVQVKTRTTMCYVWCHT
jgi:hypothetical protein